MPQCGDRPPPPPPDPVPALSADPSALDDLLRDRSYVGGDGTVPTEEDARLLRALEKKKKGCADEAHDNLERWRRHLNSFPEEERKKFPSVQRESRSAAVVVVFFVLICFLILRCSLVE